MSAPRDSITDRIFSTFPSGQYCLPALMRILEVVESDAVPSAAVECTARPHMYINPAFVAEHAQTPGKLLMLVMHELHHVVLGHTRLYRRIEGNDNLVFDAVINAMLCRLFPDAEYTELFTDLYSESKYPECFLRPPASWHPAEPVDGGCETPSALISQRFIASCTWAKARRMTNSEKRSRGTVVTRGAMKCSCSVIIAPKVRVHQATGCSNIACRFCSRNCSESPRFGRSLLIPSAGAARTVCLMAPIGDRR